MRVRNPFSAAAYILTLALSVYTSSESTRNTLSLRRYINRMDELPDPRVNGNQCGLQFETTEYFLCDPNSLLTPHEQAKVITTLNTVYATRVHQCNDGVTEPLLITLVVVRDAIPPIETSTAVVPSAELLLERILDKASKPIGVKDTDIQSEMPLLAECSKHLGILIQPENNIPILSIRCNNALQPIFTEPEYPALLENSLLLYHSAMPHDNATVPRAEGSSQSYMLATRLIYLIKQMAEDFPRTEGRKGSIARVIQGIQGKYMESVEELELEAEDQIKEIVNGHFDLKESIQKIFITHTKSLMIVASVLLGWTLMLEILHQILLRRFERRNDSTYGRFQGYHQQKSDERHPMLTLYSPDHSKGISNGSIINVDGSPRTSN